MFLLASAARFLFAVSIIAFGVQHIFYGEFVTRLVPKLATHNAHRLLGAYAVGIVLLGLGGAILFRKTARVAAAVLGGLIMLSFVFFYVPMLVTTPPLGVAWTNAGKALALAGGALLIAGWPGTVLLSLFLIVAGIQHFLFAQFVASLVPRWIPGHLFWTYFAGVALIAGGFGMLVPRSKRTAAALTAVMILLWVVLLHIPRALAAPHDANETTAVFEAVAVGATTLLAAVPNRGVK